jgi:hypothetical protein
VSVLQEIESVLVTLNDSMIFWEVSDYDPEIYVMIFVEAIYHRHHIYDDSIYYLPLCYFYVYDVY